MRRRDFLQIGMTGGLSLIGVRTPRADAKKAPARIGVLLPVPGNDPFLEAFRVGLRELGWSEGADFVLEVRRADGTVAQFRQFGAELSALPVDAMVTASTAAAAALGEASKDIPVVFVGAFDPVAAGLVATMEHPGKNLTGIAGFQDGIAADWVAILREIAPQVARIGVFSNPASVSRAALAGWKTVAARNAEIYDVFVDAASDIAPSVAAVARDAHAGLIVVPHTFPFANRKRVVEAMAQYRVPAVYGIAEMVRAGGLVSYGQDLGAQWRMAASYVDKILKGAKASDLPARYANKYALAINTRAAAAMGLEAPASLLARADEVVG